VSHAESFPLTTSLQDVSHLGSQRRYALTGTAETVVAFVFGQALGSTSFGRVKDPRVSTLVDPIAPTPDLMLRVRAQDIAPGATTGTVVAPTFTDPTSFLGYVLLSGTVTAVWVDAIPQFSASEERHHDNTEM
jgi:hypothetical protein